MLQKHGITKGMRLKHVLMIGLQVLHRIRDIHSLGYVHGDVKPLNLLFGTEKTKNTVYLIDFGLTKKESNFDKARVPSRLYQRENLILTGTPAFASINLHLGWDKTFKKDDIESLFYLLLYLSKGRLPWSALPVDGRDNYEGILKAKMNIDIENEWINLPKAFVKFFYYYTNLENGAVIDYDLIEGMIREAAEEAGIKLLVRFTFDF